VTAGFDLAGCLRRRAGEAWPGTIEHHASVPSTNDRLKEWARQGAAEWSVVVADAQTAGRGRAGHSWTSPPGNLYLSVLLRPRGVGGARLLPLLAGVGAAEALAEWGVEVALKWPNDLHLGGRKVGGLLAESSGTGTQLDWVVLGLGLNLTAAPGDVAGAIAIADASATVPGRDEAAAAVLARWRVWYDRLSEDRRSEILHAWNERALPWWGAQVSALHHGRRIEGRAIGLDHDGGFVIEMEDGSRVALASGEVSLVRRLG
jgi:BirA family biotin operon repressor/biotin-[acetyl-CoA-carboxylase] ligase